MRCSSCASRWSTAYVAALVALTTAASSAVGHAAQDGPRTNIVIIFADDLGYGDLGCYGHPTFRTPNIDCMAREGVRMRHFYVPMPYCAPSRGTLLTGRYPWRHGLTTNPAPDARPPKNDVGLPLSELTLAEVFRKAGYATICIGKWHLGHRPEFLPTEQGFDEYFGIPYSNDMRPVQLLEGKRVVEYPVVQATLTRRYTQRAQKFIREHRDQPFFLYLPHAMPHKPLACSEEFYTPETPDDLYADVMRELDWSVGEILATLKELGLDERTLVIFTSDNGPWFGGSTGGLRGMKGTNWEGGTRVPLIARWPGRIPAGRVIDQPCCSIDIFPTVLRAAGIELPKDRVLDGRDIMPVWVSGAPSPHEALFAMRGNNLMTVRSGRWKLHVRSPGRSRFRGDPARWVDPRAPDGVTILAPYEQYRPDAYPGLRDGVEPRPMMLFDLETDPGEQHDVAADHPDVVERLKKLFDRAQAEWAAQHAGQ